MTEIKALADIASEQTSAASGDLLFIESGGTAAKITFGNLVDNSYTYSQTMIVTGTINISGGTLTLADNQILGAKVAAATDTTEGVVELSTEAENTTGTATDKVPTVAGVDGMISERDATIAEGELNGSGTAAWTLRWGFAATVTDNGTGNWTVEFAAAEADTNYIIQLSRGDTGLSDDRAEVYWDNKTTSGFDILAVNVNDVPRDLPAITVTVKRRDWA